MSDSSKLVFGFDLGTNSIGWAVLREDESGRPINLVAVGVRIFNKAVEDKTPIPKNQKRRAARLARRVIQRRARRRRRLENYLISLGFLPLELRQSDKREAVLNSLGDPYVLRARALDAALEPHELGRAVLHLSMRRGFQSTRRTQLSDMEGDPDVEALLAELAQEGQEGESDAKTERIKEEGEFKAAVAELDAKISAAGKRTLGEYLAALPVIERKRNHRTGREMIRHELNSILVAQASHHPVLTEAMRDALTHIIFFQRPLRWDARTIGLCSLEPRRLRAAKGRLEYQRFRVLQDLNYLRYDYAEVDRSTGEVHGIDLSLNPTDREKLLRRLESQRSMTWAAIRKEIGLPRTVEFNLEVGSKDKGLLGNSTACSMRRVIGDVKWEALGPEKQQALVEDLFKFEKKSAFKNRLMRHWGFDVRTAIKLATIELEPGYGSLSLKAIRRLLPHMERGMIYSDARKAAGYGYEEPPREVLTRLPAPEDLRNPIVNKALHEFRRVCNALIATYGHPECVRVELPRELTMNRKRKAAFERQQTENQRANVEAAGEYAKVRSANPHLNLPEHPRREDLIKYRLWKEQGYASAYSGRTISATELFSAAVEVDHVLPYSRSLDDSYMNKVIAFSQENRDKGNRTPFEAFSGTEQVWEERIQFSRKLPLPKRNRYLREALDSIDGFINSQLVDTAYISREVTSYVRRLGCDVSVSKGILTAWLRHRWGLNPLLGGFTKNRADHRHHAIDAAVTAAVNRSLYQRIVQLAEHGPNGASLDRIDLEPPSPLFRDELEAVLDRVIVCHDPLRKLSGAFHEATAYGLQKTPTGERTVYRKRLDADFDVKQLKRVVDPALREVLEQHLKEFGGNSKVAFSEENRPRLRPQSAPIRRVRLIAAENFNAKSFMPVHDRSGRPFKFHPFGNNHHVEVVRDRESGRYRGEFVTTWEAAQRIRRRNKPVICRDHGPHTEYVMSLHINDLVELDGKDVKGIYRVQKLDAGNRRVALRKHTAATLDDKAESIQTGVRPLMETYGCRPLRVNVLGHRIDD